MRCKCGHEYVEHSYTDPAHPCDAAMCDCLEYQTELQIALHDLWTEIVRLFRLQEMVEWLDRKLRSRQ